MGLLWINDRVCRCGIPVVIMGRLWINDRVCRCGIRVIIMGLLWINDRVCRCGIPVVIMGETGCGKTRLIKFMCDLWKPPGTEDMQNMVLVKVSS